MALMKFREPNQVKWQGVRPAHNGTQVLKNATATNQTTVLYTVPAGQTFYLSAAILNCSTLVVGIGNLTVYPDVGGVLAYLCYINIPANPTILADHFYAYPPVELLAGYTIRVYSSVAGFTVTGNIFGWVE